jgi:acetoin:2,6-dichlorophenolindophenol oxidoreductase subunit alpha
MNWKANQKPLLTMYRNLVLSRRYEEKLIQWFSEGKIPGWIHSGLGQEATGVALGECLESQDYLVPYFRSRSALIAKGMDLKRITAEILGKRDGCCRGKGGEGHIAEAGLRILGAGGLIGSPIPIGVGLGYAAKLNGIGEIVACVFGDGATSRGAFHESINMAAVMCLPMVFICENNQFAEFSNTATQMKVNDVYRRAEGYGIPGSGADGNDLVAVWSVVKEAVKRARQGKGPSLIETKTYRLRGHFEGDPCRYRSEDEVRRWTKKDALTAYRKLLKEKKLLDDSQIGQVEDQARSLIEEACQFAMDSPYPALSEMAEDVYA